MSNGRACLLTEVCQFHFVQTRCARVIIVYYLKDFRTEQPAVGTEVDRTVKSFNRPVLQPPEYRTPPLQLLRISVVIIIVTPVRLRAIAQNTVTVTCYCYCVSTLSYAISFTSLNTVGLHFR